MVEENSNGQSHDEAVNAHDEKVKNAETQEKKEDKEEKATSSEAVPMPSLKKVSSVEPSHDTLVQKEKDDEHLSNGSYAELIKEQINDSPTVAV